MNIIRDCKKLLLAAVVAGVGAVTGLQQSKAADAIPVLLCPFGCGPIAGDTIAGERTPTGTTRSSTTMTTTPWSTRT